MYMHYVIPFTFASLLIVTLTFKQYGYLGIVHLTLDDVGLVMILEFKLNLSSCDQCVVRFERILVQSLALKCSQITENNTECAAVINFVNTPNNKYHQSLLKWKP